MAFVAEKTREMEGTVTYDKTIFGRNKYKYYENLGKYIERAVAKMSDKMHDERSGSYNKMKVDLMPWRVKITVNTELPSAYKFEETFKKLKDNYHVIIDKDSFAVKEKGWKLFDRKTIEVKDVSSDNETKTMLKYSTNCVDDKPIKIFIDQLAVVMGIPLELDEEHDKKLKDDVLTLRN